MFLLIDKQINSSVWLIFLPFVLEPYCSDVYEEAVSFVVMTKDQVIKFVLLRRPLL